MDLWGQIGFGTLVLSLCSALHLVLIVISLPWLDRIARAHAHRAARHRASLLIGVAFLVVLVGHTAQVWLWAFAYLWLEAMVGLEPAVYFALSNYTTLGYGDLILDESLRVFGAFASVNGMLIFGVSTAYLVGVLGRVLPKGLQ